MFNSSPHLRPVHFESGYIQLAKDAYYYSLSASWGKFLALTAIGFILINLLFGLLYSSVGGIHNANSFSDHFFFSIYTISTIGYGDMHPVSLMSHLIVMVEIFTGILAVAMITGLVFARFSHPKAMVIFSERILVSIEENMPVLTLRIANDHSRLIADASLKLVLIHTTKTETGELVRKFEDLPLVRGTTPLFHQAWGVRHIIDGESPLFGISPDEFHQSKYMILASFTGYDPSIGRTIHDRCAYTSDDLVWGGRFQYCLEEHEGGGTVLNTQKFHLYELIDMSGISQLNKKTGILKS